MDNSLQAIQAIKATWKKEIDYYLVKAATQVKQWVSSFFLTLHGSHRIIKRAFREGTARRITIFVVKRSRMMYGRNYNSAFPAGLIQDLIPVTIYAIGVWSLAQIIPIKHFFERIEK